MKDEILFIGVGNMGFALLSAWEKSGGKGAFAEKDSIRSEWIKSKTSFTEINLNKISEYGIIVLSIKPQQVEEFFKENAYLFNKDQILISVIAGLPIKKLESLIPSTPIIVRSMPNTPALVSEGLIAIASSSKESLDKAEELFKVSGKVIKIQESLMDAVTGVSGSGPAYVFKFIECFIEAAEKNGLSPELSEEIVLQTVKGALKLLKESGEKASSLREKVTSPNGTTFAGLAKMNELGFEKSIKLGIDAAVERSRELGK